MIIRKSSMSGRNGTSWRTFAASLVVAGVAAVGTVNAQTDTVKVEGPSGTIGNYANLGTAMTSTDVASNHLTPLTFTLSADQNGLDFPGTYSTYSLFDSTKYKPLVGSPSRYDGLVNLTIQSDVAGTQRTIDKSGITRPNARILCTGGIDNVTLKDLLITGGTEDFAGHSAGGGAALAEFAGAVIITNSSFVGNTAISASTGAVGGGLWIAGETGNSVREFTDRQTANAHLTDVVISGNQADASGYDVTWDKYALGGGLYVGDLHEFTYGATTATGSSITGNDAKGDIYAQGGGLYFKGIAKDAEGNAGSVAITGVTISGNQVISRVNAQGGGVYIEDNVNGSDIPLDATFTFTDNNFTDNKAISAGGIAQGGAIWTNANITIAAVGKDVIFSGNQISTDDGATYTHNDIYLDRGAKLTLAAADGKTITLEGGVQNSGSDIDIVAGKVVFGVDSITNIAGVITITGDGTVVEFGGEVTAGSLVVGDAFAATDFITVTNTGDLTVTSVTITNSESTLANTGNFTAIDVTVDGGKLTNNGGTLAISGEIVVTGGGEIDANEVIVNGGKTSTITGTFNAENVTVTDTNTVLTWAAGSSIGITETITASDGGTLVIDTGAVFTAQPDSFTLSDGTLRLTDTGNTGDVFETFVPVTLAEDTRNTIDIVTSGSNRTVRSEGGITGGGDLTVMNSDDPNTEGYVGTLILDSRTENEIGALTITKNAALQNDGKLTTGDVTVTGSNSALILAAGSANKIVGAISVDQKGTLEIANGADFTDSIIPGLTLDEGTLKLTGMGTVNTAVDVTLETGGGTVDVNADLIATQYGTISGDGALTKTGMGTLTLSGTNNYDGATTINDGTLKIASGAKFTKKGNATVDGATSILELQDGIDFTGTTDKYLTLKDGGTLALTGGGDVSSALVTTLVGDAGGKIDVASGMNVTASGTISGDGALTKIGMGTLILTGTNTYSGSTVIEFGTLALRGAGSIAYSSGVNLRNSAKFDISGTTATINDLYGSETSEVVLGSQILTLSGGAFGGIFSGDEDSGVTKIDDDSLALSGDSFDSFTGTFRHNSGDVLLADGAKLGGTYTQAADATLITTGNVTLGDATFAGTVDLGIDGNKKISATSVNLAGGTLNITGYTPDEASPYPGQRQPQTVITTTEGVTGFDTSTLTIADQAEADFLSASAKVDGNNVVVETQLTWYSTDPERPAHGDFKIDSNTFTLGAVLAGTAENDDWDGESLTKLGAGTLILTADNEYTGVTTVAAGKLALSGAGSIAESSKLKLTGTTSIFDISGISNSTSTASIKELEGVTGTSIILGSNTLSVDSGSFAGIILGSGGLTKTSDGTLILTGTNAYTGKTTVSEGNLTIGSGSSLSVTAFLDKNNAMVSVADGATFGVTGTLIVHANAYDLSTVTTTAKEFYFADTTGGGSVSATNANLDYSSISTLTYNTSYEENADHLMIAKKSANEIKYVSNSVAESLISYTPGDGNTFLDNVFTTSTGDNYTDAERFELGYNMAGAIGVGFQTASAGSQFRNSVQQQLAGRAASVSLDENCLGQATSMGFATTERAFWVTPMYGHQQASGLHSGDVKYGYASDQYGAAFGVEASQGQLKFGIAAQLGGGSATSDQTVAVRTKSESVFGGVGLYSVLPVGYMDIVSQLGWVGTSNKLKQTNGGTELSADVNGGLIFYSLGFEKTFRYGSAYVTPLVGLEYGYVYQGAFDTADAGGTNVFKADKGGAHMVTLPVGLRVGYEYNSLHPGGYGIFTPELSARFLPNVGDTELPYTTIPTGATAAKLRGLVGDKTAGDVALGLNWRGRVSEVGVRYSVLFSERFTNQDASLMLRRTF